MGQFNIYPRLAYFSRNWKRVYESNKGVITANKQLANNIQSLKIKVLHIRAVKTYNDGA